MIYDIAIGTTQNINSTIDIGAYLLDDIFILHGHDNIH